MFQSQLQVERKESDRCLCPHSQSTFFLMTNGSGLGKGWPIALVWSASLSLGEEHKATFLSSFGKTEIKDKIYLHVHIQSTLEQ